MNYSANNIDNNGCAPILFLILVSILVSINILIIGPGESTLVSAFLVGTVLFFSFIFLFRLNGNLKKKRRNRSQVMTTTSPILYLRSFRSDSDVRESKAVDYFSLLNPIGIFFYFLSKLIEKEPTFEERIKRNLSKIGPVIAFADPYETRHSTMPIQQITRLPTILEDWKIRFDKIIESSVLILVRADDTDSLNWEIQRIFDHNFSSKLIIYFQFSGSQHFLIIEPKYRLFIKKLNRKGNFEFPKRLEDNKFLSFENGVPFLHKNEEDVIELKIEGYQKLSFIKEVRDGFTWSIVTDISKRISLKNHYLTKIIFFITSLLIGLLFSFIAGNLIGTCDDCGIIMIFTLPLVISILTGFLIGQLSFLLLISVDALNKAFIFLVGILSIHTYLLTYFNVVSIWDVWNILLVLGMSKFSAIFFLFLNTLFFSAIFIMYYIGCYSKYRDEVV